MDRWPWFKRTNAKFNPKRPTFNKFKVRFFGAKLTLIVESTEV